MERIASGHLDEQLECAAGAFGTFLGFLEAAAADGYRLDISILVVLLGVLQHKLLTGCHKPRVTVPQPLGRGGGACSTCG